MRYLLDTCVISEYTKPKPSLDVMDWVEDQPPEDVFLSVVTFAEIQKGIEKLPRSKRKTAISQFLQTTIVQFKAQTLDIDLDVSICFGKLSAANEAVGRSRPVMDTFIAATASVHDLTVVTRNTADFAGTGVQTLNIWEL